MEASMDGMAIADSNGHYTYLNEAHAHVYGYASASELLGKSWNILYDAHELAKFQSQHMPLLWKTGRWRGEAIGLRKDGTTFPQEVSLTVFGDGGLICVVRDISAQKQIERSLIESSAAMQTLVSIASHELKNPLTVFQSYIDLLTRRVALLAPRLESSDNFDVLTRCAQDACARMRSCINTFLDTSRIVEGRLTMEPERFDLSEKVRTIVAQYAFQGGAGAQCPILVHAPEPIFMRGDRLQLRHMISNLISNALKYGDGKPVEITVAAVNGKPTLVVKDQGIGISTDSQQRIFGRFERAVTSSRFEGSGLGLWIVAQIIEAHEGTIELNSGSGTGTTFTVTFPRPQLEH
ncbi:MAG: PAS domain-containing sensor histidine kinase [Deltaproteobacteria bacterium]|nr:PAS domain-containing sensor histidine kinase [Deltaproteobacteria bacterium]